MAPAPLIWDELPRGPLWLTPPRLSASEERALAALRARSPADPELIWALSSGTESVGRVKALGLTREGILASAAAVNRHLRADKNDRWLVAIPQHHVGGFAIAARAHVSGAGVDALAAWSAEAFRDACLRFETTLSSLVPTQVHDLVQAGLTAPASLRAIVVGGGALSPELYKKARALGWPTLPSYGLTETASQVATAPLNASPERYPALEVLPHARVELRDGRVWIQATSLARWRAVADGNGTVTIDDPRVDGWLETQDLGEWDEGLRILGRRDDVVKILGTLVSVPLVESEVRARLDDARRVIVLAAPDARAGARLIAFTDDASKLIEIARAVEAHNAAALGPRRVLGPCWVPKIPRGELGKVRRKELLDALDL